MQQRVEHVDDDVAEGLEAGAHELDDERSIIAIANQGRTAVTLAVYDAICGRDRLEWRATADGGFDAPRPPVVIERDARVAVHHAERDLRRRAPKRYPDRFPSLVFDTHRSRGR
jgi:hypothetical protein